MKVNSNGNKDHIHYQCKVRDKVFALYSKTSCVIPRKLSDSREGPCCIIEVEIEQKIFYVSCVMPHFRCDASIFKSQDSNKR